MQRAIITPAVLPPAALAELKQWLAISTSHDDAVLTSLLRASLDVCEHFTGVMPLASTCEEVLPACRQWRRLTTQPVQSITDVSYLTVAGSPSPLAAPDFEIELTADGAGLVRVNSWLAHNRIAVRFTAGLAPDWQSLPETLRHGVLRLAAHQHRERESNGGTAVPPAAVVALWRPWRRIRL